MSSRRQEERNEKIIRGLMKLPPNRRCINCNSVGPQYVCSNFWTFICISCSGIHREFTHRVKSVSMAKFTSEEVDALQNGGNQRARELYLKAWPQKLRLPDNSNTDKVRDFIKKVYVDKKFSVEESSDATPSRDSESLASQENETRRASSYHSFSQSPPYDFQYEERRYGKHAPSLTRKPGSDKGLYEGKLASFLSPTRLSHHANDGSDYSLSPTSQRGNGSPLSETSRVISSEVPQVANSRSNGGRASHPQRTASFGNSVSSKPDKSVQKSLDKSSSFPSLPQSSVSTSFGGLDLFSAPFAPQNVTPTTSTGTNVNLIQQSPISSVPTFIDQQPSQIPQPSPLDLLPAQSKQQSAAPSNGKAFDAVMPNTGAWTTFEIPQSVVPMGTENFAPSSDGKISKKLNSFVMDQSSPYQESHAFGHESHQNVVPAIHNPHLWNAYSAGGQQTIQDVQQRNEQGASSVDKSLGFGGYEAFRGGSVKMLDKSEPPSSSLSSNFSMVPNGFPMISTTAGLHSFAPNHKPTNPFDLPGDSEMESSTMSQFWNMSSLQAALPNGQPPAGYVRGVNQSWFPPNSVPSHVPAGVSYDPIGSLGYIAGQATTAQMPNIHAQGHFSSVGGNPFA